MKSGVIVLIFLAIAVVVAGSYFWFSNVVSDDIEPVYCTADAKLCPDGSYVARDPATNCEFFTCPEVTETNETEVIQQPQTFNVQISGYSFVSSTLEINAGDTVVWTNKDSVSHTITSDSGTELNSQYLSRNGQYSHTFPAAGTYDYHCTPHPYMKGTIIVR